MPEESGSGPFGVSASGDPASHSVVSTYISSSKERVLSVVKWRIDRRKRRRRLATAAVIALGATTAIAAAFVVAGREPTEPAGILCYEEASRDADTAFVARQAGTAPAPEACLSLLGEGVFFDTYSQVATGSLKLVGCVTDSGLLVVFPSDDDDLCKQLNLAEFTETDPGLDRFQVYDALVALFDRESCISVADASAAVDEIIAEFGTGSLWRVEVGTPTDLRPCAGYSLDVEHYMIRITPTLGPPA